MVLMAMESSQKDLLINVSHVLRQSISTKILSCEMRIGVPLIPLRTMLIRCSMEQSTTITVPWPPHTIELPLWRQKLPVSGESWQGSLEETSPPRPRYQSRQHLQALKTRCTCMIGWARLLYIVRRPVLLQTTRKSCVPSLDYVLPLKGGKRDVDCDKQIEKAVTAPNCVLKGSWGEGGSGGIRKKLKSEYAAYLESKFRRNDGSSI